MITKPLIHSLIAAAVPPKIKEPAGYDVSDWQAFPVWANVKPTPRIVIAKATEGAAIKDDAFLWNMDQLRRAGIWRGAYHFHRKARTARDQAENFINLTKPVLKANDYIALDVEEGGETAAQLIAWIDLIERAYPQNEILIYSTKLLLEAIQMTRAQADRFRRYHTWIAGYPYFPDQYDTIPSWYIPDPNRFGSPWMWQYAEGAVAGIQGSKIDLDWLAPEFLARLPIEPGPAPAWAMDITVRFP